MLVCLARSLLPPLPRISRRSIASFQQCSRRSPTSTFISPPKEQFPVSLAPILRSRLHTSAPLLEARSEAEEKLVSALAAAFPRATDIAVVDISGGCGSMYEVFVEAPEFRGVRLVKQHRLVTLALKAEIGEMHGIRIATQASPGCGE